MFAHKHRRVLMAYPFQAYERAFVGCQHLLPEDSLLRAEALVASTLRYHARSYSIKGSAVPHVLVLELYYLIATLVKMNLDCRPGHYQNPNPFPCCCLEVCLPLLLAPGTMEGVTVVSICIFLPSSSPLINLHTLPAKISPSKTPCTHKDGLQVDVSDHAASTGFTLPNLVARKAAATPSGRIGQFRGTASNPAFAGRRKPP